MSKTLLTGHLPNCEQIGEIRKFDTFFFACKMGPMSRRGTFTEQVEFRGGLKVDREKNTIYGVKILGFRSSNNRYYTPSAVKRARPLYEGVLVNCDHPEGKPDQPRSVRDRIGKLVNVRFVEGKGLYADLVYNPGHEMAESLVAAALNPNLNDTMGLSHNAQGQGDRDANGVLVVSEITEVRHVDLVADAATTMSLKEGFSMSVRKAKDRFKSRAMIEAAKAKARKAQKTQLTKGTRRKVTEGKAPARKRRAVDTLEADDDETQDADLLAKYRDQIAEIVADTDMDDDEKTDAILALYAKMDAEDDEADTEEADDEDAMESDGEDDEDEDTKEEEDDEDEDEKKGKMEHRMSKKPSSKFALEFQEMRQELAAAKKEKFIRELCESSGVAADKGLIADLMAIPGKKTIENMVKREATRKTKARSGFHGFTEGETGSEWNTSAQVPKKADELAAWLVGG